MHVGAGVGWGLFAGVKRPERETDNSSQSRVTVKNELSSSASSFHVYGLFFPCTLTVFNVAVVK